MNTGEIRIFQNPQGSIKIDVRVEEEAVWLTQARLCDLFQKSKVTRCEHIKNVFEEGELNYWATVRDFRTTAADGKPYDVNHYNLTLGVVCDYVTQIPSYEHYSVNTSREYILFFKYFIP